MGLWPLIEPHIERALENSFHELSLADICVRLLSSQMVAFIAERGESVTMVCVMEMIEYPQYNVAHIVVMAGRDFRSVHKFQICLEAWALAMGCVEIRGTIQNEATVRLFLHEAPDFKRAYTIVRHDLRGRLQ